MMGLGAKREYVDVSFRVSREVLAFIDWRCKSLKCARSRYLELLALKGGYTGPLT